MIVYGVEWRCLGYTTFNIANGLPLQDNGYRFNLFALRGVPSGAIVAKPSLSVRRNNNVDVWSLTSNVGTWYATSEPIMNQWHCVEF